MANQHDDKEDHLNLLKEEIELYGEPAIATYHANVPLFLKLTYIVLPVWGIAMAIIYFNGSIGWLDRGAWHQLQIAANTTLPYENYSLSEKPVNPSHNKKDKQKKKDFSLVEKK